jgi:spermidine synthase
MTILFVLFLVSGATGLAYEIIWTRLLIRVFGATSFAVTTVLASYMGGLALGSYLFGRLIDRKGNPARIYGLLQLGIGGFALLFPLVLMVLNPIYRSLYPSLQGSYHTLTAVRFVLCFLVLLIPTTLMGGTLPVLSKYVVRNLSHLTQRVGTLYAVNTAGAVLGAFGAGFLLLPALGIRNATVLCSVINIVICGIALLISVKAHQTAAEDRRGSASDRGAGPEKIEPPDAGPRATGQVEPGQVRTSSDRSSRWDRLILIVFLITGFLALSIEVIWTRVLTLVIGTTVYAFSIMLTTFLLGLALGSAVFARIAQRTRHPGRVLGLLVASIGITVFLSSIAFGKIPLIYMYHYEHQAATWGGMVWLKFLLCFIIMLVPTFLMGGVFPIIARIYARSISKVGREIGTVYAFNTVGSILGSIAGSFLFLRFLGVEHALIAISGAYLAVSIVLLFTVALYRTSRARVVTAVSLILIGAVLLTLSPGWDKKIMTSGVYRYAPLYRTVEGLKEATRWRNILFYDEDPGATVSVERNQNEIALIIDGKGDASTGITDMTTQLLLAHLPLLSHADPDTLLIIGLGAGVTLGSAEQYDVSHIDCVELLGGVVEAADYFKAYTYDCLRDPRVNMIVGDARNHILLSDQAYDVVISQPPNPWISGVGDLFTLEFFEMMKTRLKPGGIICNWLHIYHMGDEDLRATVKSYLEAFPYVTLWMVTESDIIMLGSEAPFVFDGHLAARMEAASVASDLRRIWIDDPADILSMLISDTQGLRAYAEAADRVHTDDNMLLEFSAAKRIFESTQDLHLSNFLHMMKPPAAHTPGDEAGMRLHRQVEARKLALMGNIVETEGNLRRAIAYYDTAYALAAVDPYVTFKYAEGHLSLAHVLIQRGDYDQAAFHYRQSLVDTDYPRAWVAYRGLANCAIARRDFWDAHENLMLSLERNSYNARGYYQLGTLELARGNTIAARAAFTLALELAPQYADAANQLARIYLEEALKPAEALRLAEHAVAVSGRADYLTTLGWAYHKTGDRDRARRVLRKTLDRDPANPEAIFRLAQVELSGGNQDEYRRLLESLVSRGGDDEYTRQAKSLLRTSGMR